MPQKWRIYHDSTDDSLSLGCFAYSDAECTDWHYILGTEKIEDGRLLEALQAPIVETRSTDHENED